MVTSNTDPPLSDPTAVEVESLTSVYDIEPARLSLILVDFARDCNFSHRSMKNCPILISERIE